MAGSQVLWDESVDGHPSGLVILPEVSLGSNTVAASSQIVPFQYGYITEEGDFLLTIPFGLQVDHIVLTSDVLDLFIEIFDSTGSTLLGFLGYRGAGWQDLYPTNGDILPQMEIGQFGSHNYGMPPLESGTYKISILNEDSTNAPSTAHYQLDFETATAVPEPTPFALIGCLVIVCSLYSRYRPTHSI